MPTGKRTPAAGPLALCAQRRRSAHLVAARLALHHNQPPPSLTRALSMHAINTRCAVRLQRTRPRYSSLVWPASSKPHDDAPGLANTDALQPPCCFTDPPCNHRHKLPAPTLPRPAPPHQMLRNHHLCVPAPPGRFPHEGLRQGPVYQREPHPVQGVQVLDGKVAALRRWNPRSPGPLMGGGGARLARMQGGPAASAGWRRWRAVGMLGGMPARQPGGPAAASPG
jgi:hypothetical protein